MLPRDLRHYLTVAENRRNRRNAILEYTAIAIALTVLIYIYTWEYFSCFATN